MLVVDMLQYPAPPQASGEAAVRTLPDAVRPGGVGQQGQLGQPWHGVDLEQPRHAGRVSDDVDPPPPGPPQPRARPGRGPLRRAPGRLRNAPRDSVALLALR